MKVCPFCGEKKIRYTDAHRICGACGVIQEKIGKGNHRKIPTKKLKKSQYRGQFKNLAMGNRRTALAPSIEALLRVK